MIPVTDTEGSNTNLKTTTNFTLTPVPNAQPPWLKRARIIAALVYVLLQTAYFIFLVVCIALYPKCEKAPSTSWWVNSVFLRFSSQNIQLNNLNDKLNDYKTNYNMQGIWLRPIFPLSNQLNPLTWYGIDPNLGDANNLTNLINKAHENDIRILMDYPLNHLSVESSYFNDDYDKNSYFVWNEQGNTSNWKTVDKNQESAWIYENKKSSFYLHQFNNNDSIDINYRNNRVFNDIINSFSYWNKNYQFDGFNLQGISYAYEDYEFKNETNSNYSQTRHLEEDYLLLARIKTEIDQKKILLLDSIDSLLTSNEEILTRYYGDKNKYLGGVDLAAFNNYKLTNESQINLTMLFDNYYNSLFFQQEQRLIWSSLSSNSKLNEAFYAACLFHIGSISIDIDREQLSIEQLGRLRQIITYARTLDVFRVGRIEQNILSNSQWLTIERSRRGSKHHMIIINFSNREQEDKIQLKQGITNAVEVLLTNIEDGGSKYEINSLIDMSETIRLKPSEYLIIRWSPSIQGLGVIF